MPSRTPVTVAMLKALQPIAALSETRLRELAALLYVEQVSRQLDPFRLQSAGGKMVYLLRGELALMLPTGAAAVLVGGSEDARFPVGRRQAFTAAKAITDLELIRIDDDLVDIMLTWDQIASFGPVPAPPRPRPGTESGDWRLLTGVFSLKNLQTGAFSRLPPAHIGDLFRRFERVEVKRGQIVVEAGGEGDFYYVIENGRAQVTRTVGGVEMKLAQLKAGDAFGEEALLSDAKRNATVTMLSDGSLLRLSKVDFNELLRVPFLRDVDFDAARDKIARGGQWIDVRYPSEYQFDKLPGALNIPLSEIRNAAGILERDREYVLYCQTGRRSAAAAFLLAQRGFTAYVLAGGLAAIPKLMAD